MRPVNDIHLNTARSVVLPTCGVYHSNSAETQINVAELLLLTSNHQSLVIYGQVAGKTTSGADHSFEAT